MILIHKLKSSWNALKAVRILLGILILYSSVAEHNTTGVIMGSLFTVFALFTDGGCCIAGSCKTSVQSKNNAIPENIEYEELGNK